MSNRRKLKKTINYICGDLLAELVTVSFYEESTESVDCLMTSILMMHSNYVRRVSHVEPGMKAKVYFKDLKNGLNKEVGEIVDQINSLG